MGELLDHLTRKEDCTMKNITVITLVGAFATLLALGTASSQSAGPPMKGENDDRTFNTYCQPLWGRSTYLGEDWNIERGMIRPGWHLGMGSDMGDVYPWYNPPYRRFATPIDKKDAQTLAENYLDSTHNPNLKLGNERDEVTNYEFDIVTKDNSLVDRLLVNKKTGDIRSAY
jgi:hypothetical protein